MLSTALYAGASYGQTATAPASAPIGVSQIAQAVQIAQTATQAAADASEIIVTGTRESNQTARESPTPIAVISAEALTATGQTNVLDALESLDPSVTSAAVGADTSQLVRSLRLRGLSPGQVLVLVDGKRRHSSAQLNPDAGLDQGSTPVDLDMLPIAAIDHIEILRDGAGAQYGSDAIAGVINIILRKDDSGTEVGVLGGATNYRDGGTAQLTANQGVALEGGGFIDIAGGYSHKGFTSRNNNDVRANYPLDRVNGQPKSDIENLSVNFEVPLTPSITAYGNGTVGHRGAEAYENYRVPGKIPNLWPNGFFPEEASNEWDTAFTLGLKGKNLFGWHWDISTTYGNDFFQLYTINSGNAYFANPLNETPPILQKNFFDGTNVASELTNNFDLQRDFDLGLGGPVSIAFGFEQKNNTFEIDAGQPTAYNKGGGQSEQGYSPGDASQSSRVSEAAYVDISTHIVPAWQVEVAGRGENVDDIGSSETGKFATRYDFGTFLGIRGSAGTGFHTPTLAQEHFSFVNVGPSSANGQLPVSSNGAALVGAKALKPETSTDFSFGFVSEPIKDLHLTFDVYQINIYDRILDSATQYGANSLAAILANGGSVDSDVPLSNIGVQYFANSGNTRTRGADFTADYKVNLPPNYGTLKVVGAGAITYTTITSEVDPSLFDIGTISELTTANPHSKITLAGFYHLGDWAITPRLTRYSGTLEYVSNLSGTAFIPLTTDAAYILDLDVGYQVTDYLKVTIGAKNLTDHMPGKISQALSASFNGTGAQEYPGATPWGLLGEFTYARLTANF